jgi:hypothetical protein
VEVNGATASSYLGKKLKLLFNLRYSPSHRQAGTRVMNIQSILCKAPDLCKNVSLAVLIGSSGNIKSLRHQISVYIFFFLSFNLLVGWQLSIWNCSKPFFSLLCNCHTLIHLHTYALILRNTKEIKRSKGINKL